MEDMDHCNCPPASDVFSGRAGETKPDCPVHPMPPWLADVLVPRIDCHGFGPPEEFKIRRKY